MRIVKCDTCGKEVAIHGYQAQREAITDWAHSHEGIICKSQERLFTVTISNKNRMTAEYHFCDEKCLIEAAKKWNVPRN